MSVTQPHVRSAFARLERDLLRRRITDLDRRLAIEIAVLIGLVWGFCFWQARIAFAILHGEYGTEGVLAGVGGLWLAIAAAAGGLAGGAMGRDLRRGPAGLAWLALPIPAHAALRHVAWNARVRGMWPALLGPPVVVAAAGFLPLWWLLLLAALLVWLVIEISRLACAIAWRAVLAGTDARPIPPHARLLATAPRETRTRTVRPARWARMPRWVTLWRKDVLLTLRVGAVRHRLAAFLVPAVASAAVWLLPVHLPMARVLGFALALIAAAAFGEWMISLATEDPFPFLRAQPLGIVPVWSGRAAWAVLGGFALGGIQLAVSTALPPHARHMHAIWIALATLAIGLLAIQYSLTLFPRAERAARMLTLSLGLAMAASLMIPLAGWVVLLTAVIHSARRLPRWARLEPTA